MPESSRVDWLDPDPEPQPKPAVPDSPAAAGAATPDDRSALTIQMPVDVRHVTLTIGAIVGVIWLLQTMREVLIPFVVSGLLFYALDPFVDRLQKWRVPRLIGATLVLLTVVAGGATVVYYLSDQMIAVVEQVPRGARQLRDELGQSPGEQGAIEKVQQAADAIDRTAAESAGTSPAPRGVTRVQIEQLPVRASDYLWSASLTVPAAIGLSVMIFFLTLFLLVADDLFKRKLVKHVGAFERKRITVQILDEIGSQIERFLLVQILTSVIVGVVTGFALWYLGLQQPAVWGMVAGLLNTIPYFGPAIVTALLSVVSYMQFGDLGRTVTVSITALAITTLEGWVLTPVLLGKVSQMNRIAIFAALLFWTWVWGVWGMLLAIPITMAIKVICDHVEPFRPVGDFLGE